MCRDSTRVAYRDDTQGFNVSTFLIGPNSSKELSDNALIRVVAIALRLLMPAAVLFFVVVVPTRAAEQETRVLFLNGADPYVPAFRVIDNASARRWPRTRRCDFSSFPKHSMLKVSLSRSTNRSSWPSSSTSTRG